MTMRTETKIGVYLLVSAARIDTAYQYFGCIDHGEKVGMFCQTCGRALGEQVKTKSREPHLDEILTEDKWIDVLFEPEGVDGLPKNSFIAMDNSGDVMSFSGDIIEITPEIIDRCLFEFQRAHAEILAALHQRAISVEVKFGAITYTS